MVNETEWVDHWARVAWLVSGRHRTDPRMCGWRVPTLHHDTASCHVGTNASSLAVGVLLLGSGPDTPHQWGDLVCPVLYSCCWSYSTYGRIGKSCPSQRSLKKSQGAELKRAKAAPRCRGCGQLPGRHCQANPRCCVSVPHRDSHGKRFQAVPVMTLGLWWWPRAISHLSKDAKRPGNCIGVFTYDVYLKHFWRINPTYQSVEVVGVFCIGSPWSWVVHVFRPMSCEQDCHAAAGLEHFLTTERPSGPPARQPAIFQVVATLSPRILSNNAKQSPLKTLSGRVAWARNKLEVLSLWN